MVLDPGHGGDDSGAMCGAVMEKDLTLDVALRTELLLRTAGFKTALTRHDDRYLSLAERAEVANHEKNSLFVSIHFNDGERAAASGVETYFAPRQAASGTGIFAWLSFLQPTETNCSAAGAERESGAISPGLSGGADAGGEPRDQDGAILRHHQCAASGRAGGRRVHHQSF